jgi:hypothetical protein
MTLPLHSCEAFPATAAEQPKEEQLNLIVQMMRQSDLPDA